MIWIVIAILIAGFFIARAIQNNSPKTKGNNINNQINEIEKQAYNYFAQAIDLYKQSLAEAKTRKDKTSVNSDEGKIKSIEADEIKYITLKEKLKHASMEERLALVQDWRDLMEIVLNRAFAFQPPVVEIDEESLKRGGIRAKEIIKRFDKRFKA